MEPNVEQVKSAIRWLIATFGAIIAGFVVGKQWATSQQTAEAIRLLSDPAILSILATVGAGIWGLLVHSKSNAVAVVDKMPEVKGVILKPTIEGKALEAAVPSPTVATAGTAKADTVAAKK